MPDKERINSKIGELDSYLEELESTIPKSYKEYEGSLITRRACERLLHMSIETAIDTCSILVAELRLGPPAEEETIFDKLKEKGVISGKLNKKLKVMKKFRNVLIHRYGKINDRMVFNSLKKELSDFKIFKQEILDFLKKEKY